jgi:hypothetical protein
VSAEVCWPGSSDRQAPKVMKARCASFAAGTAGRPQARHLCAIEPFVGNICCLLEFVLYFWY